MQSILTKCDSCNSSYQSRFATEICFHSPGMTNLTKPVFVFPNITVCLECGNAGFVIPGNELVQLELQCESARSNKHFEFAAEICFHLSAVEKVKKSVILFPKIAVGLDCGNAGFVIPANELRQLSPGNESRQLGTTAA